MGTSCARLSGRYAEGAEGVVVRSQFKESCTIDNRAVSAFAGASFAEVDANSSMCMAIAWALCEEATRRCRLKSPM